MITSDSRYAEAHHEQAICHLYTDLGVPELKDAAATSATGTDSWYTTAPPTTTDLTEVSRDTTYLLTTRQQSKPPRHYMVKETDNIQLLAYRALQDPTRWWVVADANPHIRYPFDFVAGKTIHLPE